MLKLFFFSWTDLLLKSIFSCLSAVVQRLICLSEVTDWLSTDYYLALWLGTMAYFSNKPPLVCQTSDVILLSSSLQLCISHFHSSSTRSSLSHLLPIPIKTTCVVQLQCTWMHQKLSWKHFSIVTYEIKLNQPTSYNEITHCTCYVQYNPTCAVAHLCTSIHQVPAKWSLPSYYQLSTSTSIVEL